MKARIFTLFFALFAAVLGMKATDALTGFKITVSENGRTPHTEALPASKMPAIDLTDEATTSLTITGAEVSATGNVSNVQIYGTMYKQGKSPEGWMGFPLAQEESGVWRLEMNRDLIEEGMGEDIRVFEFYASATDGNNNTVYYNNGGNNYKIIFKPQAGGGGGGGDDWKVKFYDENTASITLNFNDNNQSYSYSGSGKRDPGTSQQPGGVSSLTIKAFDISFIYKDGINISDVSLQYKVYEDGGYAEWNRIDVANTQSGGTYNKDKEVWENWMTCGATDLTIDATSGLKPGMNYNLQIMYQIITTDGDYIMFLQDKETSIFRFSLSTSGVDNIKATGKKKKSVRYDLNGRKLTGKPASGYYIEDGKKYIAQ